MQNRIKQIRRSVVAKWLLARCHFVQDSAKGKQIRAGVQFFSPCLLRGHVRRRSGARQVFSASSGLRGVDGRRCSSLRCLGDSRANMRLIRDQEEDQDGDFTAYRSAAIGRNCLRVRSVSGAENETFVGQHRVLLAGASTTRVRKIRRPQPCPSFKQGMLGKDRVGSSPCGPEGGKITNKEGESSKKVSAAIERLTKLGLKVTDGTCKGKAIGFVGGVRRPEPKSTDNGKDGDSEPVVN
jgi:hypothetical protein